MAPAYARDLAITAVVCFIGGVGLALLVGLVCYRVHHRKKPNGSERQKEEEEGKETGAEVNLGVRHSATDETRRDALLRKASATGPWDRESAAPDAGGLSWSRSGEDGGYFRCSDCSSKGQRATRPHLVTWNNRINAEMEEDEETEKRAMRMVAEEQRRSPNLGSVTSQVRRENLSERPVYEMDLDSSRINVDDKEMLHCQSCQRSYRASPQAVRSGRFKSGVRDPAAFNSVPPAHRWTESGRNRNQFGVMNGTEPRRESRNVTFDLESLGIFSDGKDKRDDEATTPRGKEGDREMEAKSQSGLRVKLNLNPLRKSKVHPRKKSEREHTEERGSSRKGHDKRQRGKDRREKGGKGKSGAGAKGSPEKVKRAAKGKRTSDGGGEATEDDGEAGAKHSATVEEQSANPDKAPSGNATSAAAAAAADHVPNSQGGIVQYQGTGLVLGSALSLSALERNQTTSLSLLGSGGPQLTGSRLPLQGGNLLLGNMAPGFKALLPGGPASSAAPGVAISGPLLASTGALGSFSRQTGLDLVAPAASLLANAVHANPSIQTAPLYNPQAGGLALSLAANPAANPEPIPSVPQAQPPPDGFSLPSNPVEVPGLQIGEEFHQPIPESQAPQVQESFPVQVQAAVSLPVANAQALTAQMEPGQVPGGLTAAGGADPPAGLPGDSVPGLGDAAPLLHQEYVTEEGDSSPRRKLKLALPEKTSDRPPTALERKIR